MGELIKLQETPLNITAVHLQIEPASRTYLQEHVYPGGEGHIFIFSDDLTEAAQLLNEYIAGTAENIERRDSGRTARQTIRTNA